MYNLKRNYPIEFFLSRSNHLSSYMFQYLHKYPGLVHFILIERTQNLLYSPSPISLCGKDYPFKGVWHQQILMKKIWKMFNSSQSYIEKGFFFKDQICSLLFCFFIFACFILFIYFCLYFYFCIFIVFLFIFFIFLFFFFLFFIFLFVLFFYFCLFYFICFFCFFYFLFFCLFYFFVFYFYIFYFILFIFCFF
jgi:hypothetical protein